jgi:hypothetical protein
VIPVFIICVFRSKFLLKTTEYPSVLLKFLASTWMDVTEIKKTLENNTKLTFTFIVDKT